MVEKCYLQLRMRQIFEIKKNYSQIDQGSIITGCIAEDYPECEAWGCVITPRCDLAHEGKVSTIHYLPIINIDDWVRNEARNVLKRRWIEGLHKYLNNKLKEVGVNDGFLDTGLSDDDILKVAKTLIKKEKAYQEFEEKYFLYRLQTEENFKKSLLDNQQKGILKTLIKDLVKGNVHSFYFIESWNNSDKYPYKVILLRDVRRIRYDIAMKIAKGLFEEEMLQDEIKFNDLSLSKNKDNLFYINSQIKSPFIEHILQSFSYNFCRVGVEDLDTDNIIDNLVDKSLEIVTS